MIPREGISWDNHTCKLNIAQKSYQQRGTDVNHVCSYNLQSLDILQTSLGLDLEQQHKGPILRPVFQDLISTEASTPASTAESPGTLGLGSGSLGYLFPSRTHGIYDSIQTNHDEAFEPHHDDHGRQKRKVSDAFSPQETYHHSTAIILGISTQETYIRKSATCIPRISVHIKI